jgi:hypothetical protein
MSYSRDRSGAGSFVVGLVAILVGMALLLALLAWEPWGRESSLAPGQGGQEQQEVPPVPRSTVLPQTSPVATQVVPAPPSLPQGTVTP